MSHTSFDLLIQGRESPLGTSRYPLSSSPFTYLVLQIPEGLVRVTSTTRTAILAFGY